MSGTPVLRGERVAGAVLCRGGPAAAFAVASVAVAAAVLVPFGLWMPVVALPVLLVLGAVSWRLLRLVPVRPVPVWTAGLTVALSAGFGVWAALTRAEQVVLRRDSGTYALYAQWIATRHGLPVDPHLDTVGGAAAVSGVPYVTLASPGSSRSAVSSSSGTAVPSSCRSSSSGLRRCIPSAGGRPAGPACSWFRRCWGRSRCSRSAA